MLHELCLSTHSGLSTNATRTLLHELCSTNSVSIPCAVVYRGNSGLIYIKTCMYIYKPICMYICIYINIYVYVYI